MKQKLHEIRHWLGWHPVILLEIIHAPGCEGFCIGNQEGRPICDHKLKLQCRTCGKIEVM